MRHYAETLYMGAGGKYRHLHRCWNCQRVFQDGESYVNVREDYWSSPDNIRLHRDCAVALAIEIMAACRDISLEEER